MPRISIQTPIDQPTGQFRLLNEIKENLSSDIYTKFRLIVAFAKSGPFLRLAPLLRNWLMAGKTVEAIFGVDEKGTSIQALEKSLELMTNVNIVHRSGNFTSTFHPKLYLFQGNTNAIGYIGSNNFTVGGLETNFETLVKIEMSLPQDNDILSQFEICWERTLAVSRILTNDLMFELRENELIVDEISSRRDINQRGRRSSNRQEIIFPKIRIVPPSSVPKQSLPSRPLPVINETVSVTNNPPLAVEALVIQIVPHRNGEIFLSKKAIDQNPEFFGFPFTGNTIPKKATNPSYPQHTPDPVVNIRVLDGQECEQEVLPNHPLNTVYYDKKSEIRITVPPNIIRATPPYSIMIMSISHVESIDYEILIVAPGSQLYDTYLNSCNQQMPSGGRDNPRRFGWI